MERFKLYLCCANMGNLEIEKLSAEKKLLFYPNSVCVKLETAGVDIIIPGKNEDEGTIVFYVHSMSPSKRHLFGKTDIYSDTYILLRVLGNVEEAVLICKVEGCCSSPLNWGILCDIIWDEGNGCAEVYFWDYDSNNKAVNRLCLAQTNS